MLGKTRGFAVTLLLVAFAVWGVSPTRGEEEEAPIVPETVMLNAPAESEETEPTAAAGEELRTSLNAAATAFQPGPSAAATPAPSASPRTSPDAANPRGPRGSRQASYRLASAPDMFGDFFQSGGDLVFQPNRILSANGLVQTAGSISIPSAGGSRRVKIAENNKSMPADRLVFSYSHFENALQFTESTLNPAGPNLPPLRTTTRTMPVDRYTLGFEKMFLDDQWSCEVRMPFQGAVGFESPDIAGAGGQIGNLAIILKRLMYSDDDLAVAAGLGIDIPTGSDFTLTDSVPGLPLPSNNIVFHNDSLHLLPYAGFLFGGDRPYFINAFAQVDFAANGSRIDVGPVGGNTQTLGRFNEQNLLFLDLGTGYWLYRDEYSEGRLTSLAALLELHYTSSIQDTDTVAGMAGGRPFAYANKFNRFDILNLTSGLQAQLFNATSVRVAVVVPLGSGEDRRFFDNELQVQVNRRF